MTESSTQSPTDSQEPTNNRFKSLLNLSGWGFIPLGLFARLPLAMGTVGVLTLITSVSQSYALGGLAAGGVGIGSAIGAPILGFLADRLRQRPVLISAAVINVVVFAALLWLTWHLHSTSAPIDSTSTAGLLILSVAIGASSPQVGPLARVRWMALVRRLVPGSRAKALDTALSYESTADELTFVMGPALVGLLAAAINPWLPLGIAAILTLILVIAFALHPTELAVGSRAGNIAPEPKPVRDPLLGVRIAAPILGMICMGTFFGGTQNFLSAFAGSVAPETGGSELAGLLYAAMGLSSAATALSVAFWPKKFSLPWRWVIVALLMAVLSTLFFLPHTLVWMVVVLLIVGLPVGPTMVTMFGIAGKIAPGRWLGTVMTALASGIVAGTALGNAIAGSLAEAGGYQAALITPVLAAAALLLFGIISLLLSRLNWSSRSSEQHRSSQARRDFD